MRGTGPVRGPDSGQRPAQEATCCWQTVRRDPGRGPARRRAAPLRQVRVEGRTRRSRPDPPARARGASDWDTASPRPGQAPGPFLGPAGPAGRSDVSHAAPCRLHPGMYFWTRKEPRPFLGCPPPRPSGGTLPARRAPGRGRRGRGEGRRHPDCVCARRVTWRGPHPHRPSRPQACGALVGRPQQAPSARFPARAPGAGRRRQEGRAISAASGGGVLAET